MSKEKYSKFKIIVVDDMASLRELIVSLLRSIGFEKIHQADNGLNAFTKIKQANEEQAPFQLIFSDINMPEMNGIELVKMLKGIAGLKEIPIVMISTENEAPIVMDAIQAGAVNYILKPFTSDILIKKLAEVDKFLK